MNLEGLDIIESLIFLTEYHLFQDRPAPRTPSATCPLCSDNESETGPGDHEDVGVVSVYTVTSYSAPVSS